MRINKNEATAILRRIYFQLVDATDGLTPETGEAGGQPQISIGGAAWVNTAGVLVAIGNGRYYVEPSQAQVNQAHLTIIESRYKSVETAEGIGTTVQVFDPNADITDLLDAALGAKVLDPDTDTLTYLRRDGVTTLSTYTLAKAVAKVGAYISRVLNP